MAVWWVFGGLALRWRPDLMVWSEVGSAVRSVMVGWPVCLMNWFGGLVWRSQKSAWMKKLVSHGLFEGWKLKKKKCFKCWGRSSGVSESYLSIRKEKRRKILKYFIFQIRYKWKILKDSNSCRKRTIKTLQTTYTGLYWWSHQSSDLPLLYRLSLLLFMIESYHMKLKVNKNSFDGKMGVILLIYLSNQYISGFTAISPKCG